MKQKNTLQWISNVAGKAKLLVGVLVAVQAVLSVAAYYQYGRAGSVHRV